MIYAFVVVVAVAVTAVVVVVGAVFVVGRCLQCAARFRRADATEFLLLAVIDADILMRN